MGVSERREREKARRRASILDAAEKVFFAKGIDNATMDEVAQTAELSKGLLYFYFDSKDDLLHEIVHRGIDILETMFRKAIVSRKTGLEQLEAIGRAYVRFYQEYPNYCELMMHDHARQIRQDCTSYEHDSTIRIVAEGVANGIGDGSVRPELDPLKTALVLWAQIHGLLQIAQVGAHSFDFSEVESFTFDFTRYALANPEHPALTSGLRTANSATV